MGNISNEQIFELLQRTSQDVLVIKQDLAGFKEEIDSLKSTVDFLETENIQLKQQILRQEDFLKKKNILIFGLQETDARPLGEIVLDFFKTKLQIILDSRDLDNFYRIGEQRTTGNRPILVRFLRELNVQEVFKNAKKLKGTGLTVAKDLSYEKRAENKILHNYLKIAREKHFPAKIVKSKLIVGNDEYTVDTLKNLDRDKFLEPIVDKSLLFPNTSAPPTPTIDNKVVESDDEIFVELETFEQEELNKPKELNRPKESSKPENSELSLKAKPKATRNQQTPRTTRSGSTSSQQVARKNYR